MFLDESDQFIPARQHAKIVVGGKTDLRLGPHRLIGGDDDNTVTGRQNFHGCAGMPPPEAAAIMPAFPYLGLNFSPLRVLRLRGWANGTLLAKFAPFS